MPRNILMNLEISVLFIRMANLTLLRRDAYLDHLKPGVKQDHSFALQYSPLQPYGLFLNNSLHRAEDDITKFEATKQFTQPETGSGGFAHKKESHSSPRLQTPENKTQPSPSFKAMKFQLGGFHVTKPTRSSPKYK